MMGRYIGDILLALFFGVILFALTVVLFVDSEVALNLWKLPKYLFDVKSTWLLSVPSFGICLLISFIRILYQIANNEDDYGDAKFATNFEIARMRERGLFERKGTILGLKDGRYVRTCESLSTLIVAPQGTGKTAAIIIPTLLSDTSSAIINDVKGELWDNTSKQRSHFGKVGVFAPSQSLRDGLRWNPLDKKCLPESFDDQIDFVDRIGSILYPTEREGLDATSKHFNSEAKSIFTYWAMFLIVKNGGSSLPEIYMTALESGDMQAAIACDLDEYGESWHPILATLANSILEKGGNEYQGTVTTFKQALEPFSRPNVARNLQDCDFTHKDFKDEKPFSLYLFIPANDIARMAPIVRMLVEYLVNEFLSLTDKKIIDRQRVLFAMDEFPRMGYMQALKEAPALQRSYKMSTIFVAQDKNQLENTYGKGSFDQFVTTTDFKAIFRQNEDTTAARFSNLVGKSTRKRKSVSQQDLKLLGSSSISNEGVPLILPQDFMSQKKNELIVLAAGHHERPIKCKCAWYYKDATMRKLIGAYNGLTISDLASPIMEVESASEISENLDNSGTNSADDRANSSEVSPKGDINTKILKDLKESDALPMSDVEASNNEKVADLQHCDEENQDELLTPNGGLLDF